MSATKACMKWVQEAKRKNDEEQRQKEEERKETKQRKQQERIESEQCKQEERSITGETLFFLPEWRKSFFFTTGDPRNCVL